MRIVLSMLTILFVACLHVARADVTPASAPAYVNVAAAPADEYFGPYHQSILEIRNRLNDYDLRDDSAMLDPTVTQYLDQLSSAIRDWQHKYPTDPWLPRTFAHLLREYWRAGQVSSPGGLAALAAMRASYPDDAETVATVSLIFSAPPAR